MNTDKLLDMLLEAIDYSFLQTDGSYHNSLTYPVIDKVKYIKRQINDNKVKKVDLEKESELIANGIMISVQSNKYGTNIYNTKKNDFNHYHLQMAARKGIELGLKSQKGE